MKPDSLPRSGFAPLRKRSLLQTALRYGSAVAGVALGFAVRLAATEWVGQGLPTFITFYPAVIIVAVLAGPVSGVLATALTAAAVAYWIMPPVGQFFIASPVDRLALVLFGAMGLLISGVAEAYRRSRLKAAAYDREAALAETRRENAFLANILEHASQPFAVDYPDGRLGRTNRAYEELTGYTAAELRSLDRFTTLTPPEWREPERQKLAELNRTGRPVRYEKEYIRKDGTRAPVELFVHLVPDAEGKPDYYYSFIADITERKRAEEKLARFAQQRQLALDAAKLGWWHYDPVTRMAHWDDGYKAIFGVSGYTQPNDEILAQIIHPEDRPGLWKKVEAALNPADPKPFAAEYRINRPDGTLRWVDAHGIVTFEGKGPERRAVSFVGTVADITAAKAAEEQIQRHVEELCRANEELAHFNRAAVGRELRMVELKKEVNALSIRLGQPSPYPTQAEEEHP